MELKMKTIVLLEDNYYESEAIEAEIKYVFRNHISQFQFIPAFDFYEINDLLFNDDNSLKDEFKDCCLILDLNVPPYGLKEIDSLSKDNLKFAGWYWLKEHIEVLNSNTTIIFYSAYINDLCSYHEDECRELNDSKKVLFINKNNPSSLIDQLQSYIRRNKKESRQNNE